MLFFPVAQQVGVIVVLALLVFQVVAGWRAMRAVREEEGDLISLVREIVEGDVHLFPARQEQHHLQEVKGAMLVKLEGLVEDHSEELKETMAVMQPRAEVPVSLSLVEVMGAMGVDQIALVQGALTQAVVEVVELGADQGEMEP